mgnify:CR=1 FL=1
MDTGRDGTHAANLVKALQDRGVFIRMPGTAPLNRCIRVSAGRAEDLELRDLALLIAGGCGRTGEKGEECRRDRRRRARHPRRR